MANQDIRTIQAALAQPFAPEDLEWRLQRVVERKDGSAFGVAVPYVTNRAIQNRLDSVVGPDGWYNEYQPWHGDGKKQAQICGISIYFEGRGFITKWDGAEDTDIEPVKGGLSDSMKRAAVQWGIGRVLYGMDTVFVDVEKKGKSWVIADSSRAKLNRAYLDLLDKLKLLPAPAGGVQAQLTSTDSDEPSETQEPARPADAAKTSAPDQAEFKRTQPLPAEEQPVPAQQPPTVEYSHKVLSFKLKKGMNGVSTYVVLEDREGKRINAFVRGEHPELVQGTLLARARLTLKKQDTVIFYIMEEYEIIPAQQRAA